MHTERRVAEQRVQRSFILMCADLLLLWPDTHDRIRRRADTPKTAEYASIHVHSLYARAELKLRDNIICSSRSLDHRRIRLLWILRWLFFHRTIFHVSHNGSLANASGFRKLFQVQK
jgi:hypothetical protein